MCYHVSPDGTENMAKLKKGFGVGVGGEKLKLRAAKLLGQVLSPRSTTQYYQPAFMFAWY
jgi:hypothetical protein